MFKNVVVSETFTLRALHIFFVEVKQLNFNCLVYENYCWTISSSWNKDLIEEKRAVFCVLLFCIFKSITDRLFS